MCVVSVGSGPGRPACLRRQLARLRRCAFATQPWESPLSFSPLFRAWKILSYVFDNPPPPAPKSSKKREWKISRFIVLVGFLCSRHVAVGVGACARVSRTGSPVP